MNLAAIRTQVLSYGFDQSQFLSRITVYVNDAQSSIARRVGYYTSEASVALTTTAGTALYAWPTLSAGSGPSSPWFGNAPALARVRSLVDLDQQRDLQSVLLDDIDQSSSQSGRPTAYALDGAGLHLYPSPDGVYHLELRYWQLPSLLVNDSDVPSLPADWHRLLWMWALAECYYAEDDPQNGQMWEARFEKTLAQFSADAKFPSTDTPMQIRGMWQEGGLESRGWSLYG